MPSALPLFFFSGTLAVDQREPAYVNTTLLRNDQSTNLLTIIMYIFTTAHYYVLSRSSVIIRTSFERVPRNLASCSPHFSEVFYHSAPKREHL